MKRSSGVPGFSKKRPKTKEPLVRFGPPKQKPTPTDIQKRQKEFDDNFRALVTELNINEMNYSGMKVIDRRLGIFRWPRCWIETMRSLDWRQKVGVAPIAEETLASCTPLEESQLSPMSDRLRQLAEKLHLPLYKGRAKPKPGSGQKGRRVGSDWLARERCPRCGSWLEPLELAEWKVDGPTNPLGIKPSGDKLSGDMGCRGCGYIRRVEKSV